MFLFLKLFCRIITKLFFHNHYNTMAIIRRIDGSNELSRKYLDDAEEVRQETHELLLGALKSYHQDKD